MACLVAGQHTASQLLFSSVTSKPLNLWDDNVSDYIVLRFTTFFLFRWLFKLTSMAEKIIVVLSLAYTVIRISIRSNACPKCGSQNIIPLDTPKAREIIAVHPRR